MLKKGTWILIADGEKALFLENVGDAQDYNFEVVRKEEQASPRTSEQGTDSPGRMSDGPSGHFSAVRDTDWHQLDKDRFAHDLSEMLYQRAHAGRFEEIVIVAPPKTLGTLREHLHLEVRNKVMAEVPKTLTNIAIDKIEDYFANDLSDVV